MQKLFEIQATILSDFAKETIYKRDVFKSITYDSPITGLVGSRGVGKTTFLLEQVVQHNKEKMTALYVSADNIYFLNHTLIDLVDQLYKETDVRLLCIDEIHKYAGWDQEIKNIADTYRHFRILFSGSSMIELVHSKYDLSRRVTLHYLFGFSFREYLEFYFKLKLPVTHLDDIVNHHSDINKLLDTDQILKYFNQYLKSGYYPFFREFTLETEKYQAIENAVQKTIYEDIGTLHSLKTPTLSLIEKIYKYIINSAPGELSVFKLSRFLEKDFDNISDYIRYLNLAGLIRVLHPNKSGNAYLRNPNKLYPDNTNLIYSSYLPLNNDQLQGKIRETFALNQLQNGKHTVYYSESGDFKLKDYVFEIGGKNKTIEQIKEHSKGYVFADGILTGSKRIIPLYLLGFLY
jgi:predicted AAA+ superfamily ATPase